LFARHGDGEPNFDVELITAPQANPDGSTPAPEDPETENCPKGGITKVLLGKKVHDLFAVGDSDIALLYFSGHGTVTSVGGYILTTDTQTYDEGVAMDEILAYANHSPAREKIIIFDCCHSGAFGSPNISGSNVSQLSEGMV